MTKEELISYKYIKKEIEDIKNRINQLRTEARSPKGVQYSDAYRGRGEPVPAQQRYMERLEELSALYEAKKAELQTSLIAIERAIASLPPELRLMMRYRYIDGYKWEQVNEMMHISEPTSKRMHRKALKLLQNDLV
ncbi:MAG: RNA polymerase sigma factor [Ruminococcus sp.]